jgi:phosphoribosyl-ATP pyrophosphohydrolase
MAALVRHEAGAVAPQFPARDARSRGDAGEVARLYEALDRVSEHDHPRTARLIAAGRAKMAQKVMEEAGEVALEAVRRHRRALIRESADLVYQLVVLWRECGIAPEEVWGEMARRAELLGIAEKLPKAAVHGLPAGGGDGSGR